MNANTNALRFSVRDVRLRGQHCTCQPGGLSSCEVTVSICTKGRGEPGQALRHQLSGLRW